MSHLKQKRGHAGRGDRGLRPLFKFGGSVLDLPVEYHHAGTVRSIEKTVAPGSPTKSRELLRELKFGRSLQRSRKKSQTTPLKKQPLSRNRREPGDVVPAQKQGRRPSKKIGQNKHAQNRSLPKGGEKQRRAPSSSNDSEGSIRGGSPPGGIIRTTGQKNTRTLGVKNPRMGISAKRYGEEKQSRVVQRIP